MALLLQSCSTVARNISKAFEVKLSAAEKGQLLLHLALCSHCRAFRKQLDLMHAALRDYPDRLPEHLSEHTRDKIVEQLTSL
jgi:hypothetical protein